jgi:DNA topoisomerase-2
MVPIVPMLLVNGAAGIGTGYASNIISYSLKDIIEYIKCKLVGFPNLPKIRPQWRGFKGTVSEYPDCGFITRGSYELRFPHMKITEIPVGVWAQKYEEKLNDLMDLGYVINHHMITDKAKNFYFDVKLSTKVLDLLKENPGNASEIFDNLFELSRKHSTKTMTAYNPQGFIEEYKSVYDILEVFIRVRKEYYEIRKKYQLDQLLRKISFKKARYLFVQAVAIKKTIEVRERSKSDIIKQIDEKLPMIKLELAKEDCTNYEFLTKMPIYSLSIEELERLLKEIGAISQEYEELSKKSIVDIWLSELDELSKKTVELQNE